MPRITYNPDEGYYEEDYGEENDDDCDFADPGGVSALRTATPDNPRDRPCPNCGHPDRLTRRDVALGYQCDSCANAIERGWDIDYYDGD
jgi:hypothetical protein